MSLDARPAPSTAAVTSHTPGSWPVPLTAFIGRASLLDELTAAALDPAGQRLLTLIGPGGVGKTRLAIEFLIRTSERLGGSAWFVQLAGIEDASAIPPAVVRSVTGREAGERGPIEALAPIASIGPSLIVLDNFEHLLDGTMFVLELLAAFPALTIVVTSRESLHVRAEHVLIVPPLELSAHFEDSAGAAEATALFVESVRAMRPAFAPGPDDLRVISEICRRLDGLPLAIELAAARCRALSPRALLSRLSERYDVLGQGPRDLPERQRTMQATIRWSHDLLHEQDRAAFRRLGVFAGPFTLEAAEALLGTRPIGADDAPLNATHVLDAVSSLLDKSLLRELLTDGGDQRFVMLQTIRQFALDELREADEAAPVRDLHADWYQQRAEASWHALYQDDFDTSWLRQLEPEFDDFVQALAWLAHRSQHLALLQMAANLSAFAYFHSYRGELRTVLDRAEVAAEGLAVPVSLLAHVAHARGLCAWGTRAALNHFERSLALWRETGTASGETAAAVTLAEHLSAAGRFEEAIALAEASIEPAAQWNRFFHASCLMEIGHGHLGLGRLATARGALDAALAAARTVQDAYVLGLASNARAFVALDERDLPAARSAILESLAAWRTLQRPEGLVGAFAAGGLLAHATGDLERAAELFHAVETVCQAHDYTPAALEQSRIDWLRAALEPLMDATPQTPGVSRAINVLEDVATGTTAPINDMPRPAGLTQREMDVVRLLAEGRSDREIAQSLGISRSTAARHVANIFGKIDVNSRTSAAAWAFRTGIVSTER